MNTSTKQTENLAECGNKSKPLLQAVFLAPYLIYDLKVIWKKEKLTFYSLKINNKCQLIDIYDEIFGTDIKHIIPVLKPLGDLIKDEKTCDEINEFLEPNGLEINNFLLLKNSLNAVAISWEEMQNVLNILYREHYDVFGLINKRLAVSVHDVV